MYLKFIFDVNNVSFICFKLSFSWRMAIPFYYSINLIPQVRRFNSDVDIMKSTIRKIIHLKRLKQAQSTGKTEIVFIKHVLFVQNKESNFVIKSMWV